jgi:hypothetical protein
MTLEKICLVLKTMQYIVMMAHRKEVCPDICPMRCSYTPYYGVHNYRPYGPRYGHVYQPGSEVDIESLARAMGVPKNTFSDLIGNSSDYADPTTKRPVRIDSKKGPKGNRPPINKDAIQFMDSGLQSRFSCDFLRILFRILLQRMTHPSRSPSPRISAPRPTEILESVTTYEAANRC